MASWRLVADKLRPSLSNLDITINCVVQGLAVRLCGDSSASALARGGRRSCVRGGVVGADPLLPHRPDPPSYRFKPWMTKNKGVAGSPARVCGGVVLRLSMIRASGRRTCHGSELWSS